MTREIISGIVVLRADPGAYITNGDTFTDSAWLGKNANEADWRDATAEEYEAWQRQDDPSEAATAEDYEAALKELGVRV